MKFFEQKYARYIIWVAVILAVGVFLWATAPRSVTVPGSNENVNNALPPAANVVNGNANAPVPGNKNVPAIKKNTNTKVVGFAEKKTPHFIGSNITNNATISNSAPGSITLTFDAPITKSTQSYITVSRDQVNSATRGGSYIGGDGKTLSVNLNTQVSNGDYYVYYVACFADTGCKDGRFGYHLALPR
jgi:methionine-rich copper-binding protein CopC